MTSRIQNGRPAADGRLPEDTRLYTEASEAPAVVTRQLSNNAALMREIGQRLTNLAPPVVVTCARGSSDHAATYAKYLIETELGIPTASAAPSVSSVYKIPLKMPSALFVAISQSGRSPDLVASAHSAREGGATVLALVNDVSSPLAEVADLVVPLHAGPETSVAASKSYIATLSAIAQLVATWSRNVALLDAVSQLPEQLQAAWQLDWTAAVDVLRDAPSFFVIGRGTGLGVVQEAALKFKETAGLHAEAYSAAEVRHGPMALVREGVPVLVFVHPDATRMGFDVIVDDFSQRGAKVIVAGKRYDGAVNLPAIGSAVAATAPLPMAQSFYRMVNALAVARGFDPDAPPSLRKVTETV